MTDVIYEYFEQTTWRDGFATQLPRLSRDEVIIPLFEHFDANKLTILPEDGICNGNAYIYERRAKVVRSTPNFYCRQHGGSDWLVSISLLNGIEPALKAIPGKPVIVESKGRFYDVVYGVKEDLPK